MAAADTSNNIPGDGAFSSSFDVTGNPFQGSAFRRNYSAFESPTSTISSQAQTARMPMRTNPSSSSTVGTPRKKTIIKSDPTIVSCFDPIDKELYDLWAPKQ